MKKEKQSWTAYVPHSVSLYYVDYRENLDSHDDLQEQCIRRNSLGPLEEQILEWYADQEHDNLQGYLSEIRNEMEADGKSAEYIRHEEKIKDLLYERNNTDPAEEPICSTPLESKSRAMCTEAVGAENPKRSLFVKSDGRFN